MEIHVSAFARFDSMIRFTEAVLSDGFERIMCAELIPNLPPSGPSDKNHVWDVEKGQLAAVGPLEKTARRSAVSSRGSQAQTAGSLLAFKLQAEA